MLLTQLIAYIHWFFPGAAHQSIGFERAKDIILHKHWSLTPREDWGCKDVTQFSDPVIEKETLSNAASCHHGFGIKFRPQTKQKLDGQVEPFCIIFSLFCLLSLSLFLCLLYSFVYSSDVFDFNMMSNVLQDKPSAESGSSISPDKSTQWFVTEYWIWCSGLFILILCWNAVYALLQFITYIECSLA